MIGWIGRRVFLGSDVMSGEREGPGERGTVILRCGGKSDRVCRVAGGKEWKEVQRHFIEAEQSTTLRSRNTTSAATLSKMEFSWKLSEIP